MFLVDSVMVKGDNANNGNIRRVINLLSSSRILKWFLRISKIMWCINLKSKCHWDLFCLVKLTHSLLCAAFSCQCFLLCPLVCFTFSSITTGKTYFPLSCSLNLFLCAVGKKQSGIFRLSAMMCCTEESVEKKWYKRSKVSSLLPGALVWRIVLLVVVDILVLTLPAVFFSVTLSGFAIFWLDGWIDKISASAQPFVSI